MATTPASSMAARRVNGDALIPTTASTRPSLYEKKRAEILDQSASPRALPVASENPRCAVRTHRSNASLSLVVGARARDADLAAGLVEGEAWAIAETWHRFAPMVLMTAERSLGSRTEAEDIVQEVFCLVFRK